MMFDVPLMTKTQLYWQLSSIRNGKLNIPITTEKAITQTNSLLGSLNPMRPLTNRVYSLQEEIIAGIKPKKSVINPHMGVLIRLAL